MARRPVMAWGPAYISTVRSWCGRGAVAAALYALTRQYVTRKDALALPHRPAADHFVHKMRKQPSSPTCWQYLFIRYIHVKAIYHDLSCCCCTTCMTENAASGHGHRWGHIWTAERQLHQRFLSRVHASLLTHGREALHANAARKED